MDIPTVHLICNAHLDPVWQWRWEEGCAEALSTFRTAVQLLREHDTFIFNHNEAILYQWVEEYDPGLFSEIKDLVREERWFISGGWYLQPDVNLPGTESLIRQITTGRHYFRQRFGVTPLVAYNFDSFGHGAALPQLLTKAGYKMYIHLRPQNPDLKLPSDLYRWKGVDGSEILGYRIAVGLYHTEYENMKQRLEEGVKLALQLKRDVPVFWGIGDHGGGATREDLNIIDAFMAKEKRVKIIHSTPDRFYNVVKHLYNELPVVEGGLQRIFTGCYTSLSRLKRRSVTSLHELLQTETLSTSAWWLFNQPYPHRQLEEAWKDHLFNDFHDILPGSCTEPAEKDALDLYGKASETARRIKLSAAIAHNLGPVRNVYLPVSVLNTIPHMPHVPVEFECMISHRPKWSGKWHLNLLNRDGSEIQCQEEQPEALLPFNQWRRKICFMADLPSVGLYNYHLEAIEGEKIQESAPSALNIEFDEKSGLLNSLSTGKGGNVLSGLLLRPLIMEDCCDSWGTECWQYRNVAGEFVTEPAGTRIRENGPVRTIYQTVLNYKSSRMILDTIVYAQWPVLEYRLRIHWNEQRRRLKLSIPTVLEKETVVHEIPGGFSESPADGQEYVHGRWLIVQGKSSHADTALAVINSGQNGFDFRDGEIRLSMLRSAAYCHERGFELGNFPERKYMDQGVHDIRLAVTIGRVKEIRDKVSALANWLNTPPAVYAHLPFGSFRKDLNLPQRFQSEDGFREFFRIAPQNIRVLACKPSWDGKSLVFRLQEIAGKNTMSELNLNDLQAFIRLNFKPLEIKTIRVEHSGRWAEVDMIDEAEIAGPV
ncbi:MAG: glycoside hydrolase family 38 C-terminal domain-containing protein [Calditrichia bacterium]